jgi:hypothetical protein
MSPKQMATLEQMEDEMEELMKAMDDEYEKNKESPLYLELYTKFCELEATYDSAKKEEETFWDEYNHRPKRCILCGAHKGETTKCPGQK